MFRSSDLEGPPRPPFLRPPPPPPPQSLSPSHVYRRLGLAGSPASSLPSHVSETTRIYRRRDAPVQPFGIPSTYSLPIPTSSSPIARAPKGPLPALAAEIWLNCLEFCPRDSLPNIALVNRNLYILTRGMIWREVRFPEYNRSVYSH